MSVVRVPVPAKINLYLGVGPRRGDGYHELTTVYHAIGLYDEITVRRGGTTAITMDGEGEGDVPLDGRNLAVRAVNALAARTGADPRVLLHLRKRIPVAGGLAGGSADAAAALVACDALWRTGLSRPELARIAARIGSDVPFLLYGGTAVGTGRGELVEPVTGGDQVWHWVVAAADGGLSTPAVYAELDRLRDEGLARPPQVIGAELDRLYAALRQDDPVVLGAALHNDLGAAALSLRPSLRDTLDEGLVAGAVAGMVSGSGPSCVFLAADADASERIAERLASSGTCRLTRTATGPVPGASVRVAATVYGGER